MAEIDSPIIPPPPSGGQRDDSLGTLARILGGGCVTFCGCCIAPLIFFFGIIMGAVFSAMEVGIFIFIPLVCILIGFFAAKYTWTGIQNASGS